MQSNNLFEVDFLLYTNNGIIPVEVNGENKTKSKILYTYIFEFKPKYSIRISTKEFGYDLINKISTNICCILHKKLIENKKNRKCKTNACKSIRFII